MVEVYRDMNNYKDGHTYSSIGNTLHKVYPVYFLGYELRHPAGLYKSNAVVTHSLKPTHLIP